MAGPATIEQPGSHGDAGEWIEHIRTGPACVGSALIPWAGEVLEQSAGGASRVLGKGITVGLALDKAQYPVDAILGEMGGNDGTSPFNPQVTSRLMPVTVRPSVNCCPYAARPATMMSTQNPSSSQYLMLPRNALSNMTTSRNIENVGTGPKTQLSADRVLPAQQLAHVRFWIGEISERQSSFSAGHLIGGVDTRGITPVP